MFRWIRRFHLSNTLEQILANPLSEADSNRDGINYVAARVEWYWNLAPLLLDQNTSGHPTAKLQKSLETKIGELYQQLILYQLRSICLYHRNWAATILRDTIKFDDWAGQLAEIKNLESDVQTHIDQYSSADMRSKLQGLKSTADEFLSVFQIFTRQQDERYHNDKDDECLAHLLVTDSRDDKKRIEEKKGGLLHDSYSWILEHDDFRRFRNDKECTSLWIKGNPGKGKTMLICGIIDLLERDIAEERLSSTLSYFFCEATELKSNNATSVLRGLVYGLARQNRSLIKHIRQEYDSKRTKLFDGRNAWQEVKTIATAVLNDPSMKDAIIVVDALDECSADLEQLLDFIAGFPTTKWIVTSRNWSEIELKLNTMEHIIKLQLEDNSKAITEAVDTYVKYKVNQLAKSKNFDNQKLRHDVQQYLAENAHGTFLWVALVCHALEKYDVRPRHIMKELKSFPSDLDELYARMLKYISDLSDETDARLCCEILGLASTVYRPVTLEELKGLIQFPEEYDQDDVRDIVKSCGSFLNLSNRGDVVAFVHQSAKDFLIKKNPCVQIKGNTPFRVLGGDIKTQHSKVFSRSLELLGENLRRDICCLCAPGFLADQVEPSDLAPLANIQYSCVYWVDHLEDSLSGTKADSLEEGSRTLNIIFQFLETNYLRWLEALSLMHCISAGVKAIMKLDDMLVRIPKL